MKYTKEQIELIKKELGPINQEECFDSLLDDVQGDIVIGTLHYSPSQVLKSVDKIAYQCGINDYFGNDDDFTEIDGEYYYTEKIEELLENDEVA